MKKFFVRIIAMVLLICSSLFPVEIFAANTKAEGFPLPVKSTPYNVNVLSRYSGGSKHMPYIYQYGPLKKKTVDLNIIMDIGVAIGTEVYAVAAGKIITVDYGNNGGHYVVIEHYDGSYSYYGHLKSKCLYKVKTEVAAGQLIGYSGNSGGASTGPHLHFEWSGHDPYCMYSAKGLVKIKSGSGASKYPHTHENVYLKQSNCNHKYSGGVCSSCGYIYKENISSVSPTAYITTKSGGAPVWSRPYSNNSDKLSTIPKGNYVIVIGKTTNQAGNQWFLLSDGSWIYSGNVKKTTMPKNVRYVNSDDGLNIRAKASTSGKLLGELRDGAMVIVNTSKTSGSWIYVTKTSNGLSGWVSSKYLTTTAPKYKK